jgi:hypothetical protein
LSQSGFQQFLTAQSAVGSYDSEGAFTVDFAEAADRLSTFRLPSESHFLLKMVQLASRLEAETVRVKLESFRTSVHFRASQAQGVNDIEAITRGFLAPLEVRQPALADLIAALWGCLGESTQELAWSYSEGYRGRRVFIKDFKFRVEDFQIQIPLADGELPCAFTLSVLRRKTWRFWVHSRRNAEAYRLLWERCLLSRVRVLVDGRPLDRADAAYFASHRPIKGEFGETFANRPFHTALFQLAKENEGFELARPGLSRYLVRDHHFNVWTSGTRVNNSLKPDGFSSPSWMLQFRDNGVNLSMRSVAKRVRCSFVLAYDEVAAAEEAGFRLTFVRQSVLLERQDHQEPSFDIKPWHGCHLILDNDTLSTDLTGFQIIEDERLAELLKTLEPQVEIAKSFLAQGRNLLFGI